MQASALVSEQDSSHVTERREHTTERALDYRSVGQFIRRQPLAGVISNPGPCRLIRFGNPNSSPQSKQTLYVRFLIVNTRLK